LTIKCFIDVLNDSTDDHEILSHRLIDRGINWTE
jgi:hypothetical protein